MSISVVARMSDQFKTYRVTEKTVESSIITSFLLQPESGAVPGFCPGEYMIFDLPCDADGGSIRREYSISGQIGDALRVTIKREPAIGDYPPGRASGYFHDKITPGSTVRAAGPFGQFQLDRATTRQAVLLSGGVGLTPMVAMARELASTGKPATFIHACEDGSVHAMAAELRDLASLNKGLTTHFCYRLPRHEDKPGRDYDSTGFLTASTLQSLLPLADYDFYLCGPGPFMQAIYEILIGLSVREERISYEFFGPATLLRPRKAATHVPPASGLTGKPEIGPMVHFAKSGLSIAWDPAIENLLEFAEEQGLMPDHSCRAGTCESCKTKVLAGETEYLFQPFEVPTDGTVLICCAKPKGDIILDL